MNSLKYSFIFFFYTIVGANMMLNTDKQPVWMKKVVPQLQAELLQKGGEDQQSRIEQGLNQLAKYWRSEDGDEDEVDEVHRQALGGEERVVAIERPIQKCHHQAVQHEHGPNELGIRLRIRVRIES